MACYIGIHTGNSSACVAVGKNGKISVVANSHGDRLTPAMVTFTNDETLVGFSSKQVCHRYIAETVRHFNGVVGICKEDNRMGYLTSAHNGLPDAGLVYDIKRNGKNASYTPEKVLELLLSNLLETAMSQAGSDVREVVLTAPVGYPESHYQAVHNAASNIGFDVLRIISEPAAACLAYRLGTEKHCGTSQNIVVFRVGGVSLDVTLLSSNSGIFSIEKYVAKRSGGDILTDVIANHFASLFKKQFRVDITSNTKSMNKLNISAENCKHILSSMPSANCHIDSLYDGMDFNCNLSRSMFEMLTNQYLQNMIEPLKELCSGLYSDKSVIQKIIMTGGTCSIPRLQKLVSDHFPDAEILSSIPPSEVTAVGAATQAGLLVTQDLTDVSNEDCVLSLAPVDIQLKFDDQIDIVVKQRTILPYTAKQSYQFPENKSEVTIELCIADSTQVKGNIMLGSITVPSRDDNEVTCEIKYCSNGSITLLCDYSSNSQSFTVNALS